MTTQELEAKFNLIGDPIVRAVVRHLYDAEFRPFAFKKAESARYVLLRGFDWEKQNLYLTFWDNLDNSLIHNPNYSFTPEELQQVQESYPELFNSDGTLKENEIKDDGAKVSEVLKQHAEYANEAKSISTPKPELNRNEIAWDILMHLITSPKFDGDKKVVDNAFELADKFIKHSHESNNNKWV